MQNQKAIELTKDQQAAIVAEMQKTVSRFTELQWQQSAETETMASLIKKERVDEKEALAQLDKLLGIESEMKRLQITMLIKVKNILTPEQQAQLSNLRRQGPQPPMMRMMQMGPGGPQNRGPQPGRNAEGPGAGGPLPPENACRLRARTACGAGSATGACPPPAYWGERGWVAPSCGRPARLCCGRPRAQGR